MNSNIRGWTIEVNEFSSGFFKVALIDVEGRKAEVVGDASDATIDLAKDYAFDIERQVKRPWNKFLYEFCLLNLSSSHISATEYNDLPFGSWIIQRDIKRLIYDGRDSWLVYQTIENGEWTDKAIIKSYELKYTNFMELMDMVK